MREEMCKHGLEFVKCEILLDVSVESEFSLNHESEDLEMLAAWKIVSESRRLSASPIWRKPKVDVRRDALLYSSASVVLGGRTATEIPGVFKIFLDRHVRYW